MASRSLLHLRAGASAAARSVRGRHLPAGRTWVPATAPTTGGLADAGSFAGRIPPVPGLRHYRVPFDRDASASELIRTMRKEKKRLGLPEQESSVEEIFKSLQRNHKKIEIPKGFRRLTNTIMVVGYGTTLGLIIYHYAF